MVTAVLAALTLAAGCGSQDADDLDAPAIAGHTSTTSETLERNAARIERDRSGEATRPASKRRAQRGNERQKRSKSAEQGGQAASPERKRDHDGCPEGLSTAQCEEIANAIRDGSQRQAEYRPEDIPCPEGLDRETCLAIGEQIAASPTSPRRDRERTDGCPRDLSAQACDLLKRHASR